MNLEPEQREVGQENFYAAAGSKLTRGKFLAETIRVKLATKNGLGSKYFGYGKPDRPIRIGVIGTGDEGGVLIGALNPQFVQVVAIADIRPYNVYRAFHGDKSSPNAQAARPGLMKIYGWPSEETARKRVKVYPDNYEELLDDENVEAVIVALPLHLHAEASIKAMRKGKHVLCEKLMAHSVGQCKEMARVATQEDKLLAIGHQRHYSVLYDNAVQLIKKNLIGDIHHIRAQWHRGNLPGNDSWKPPLPDDEMGKKLEEMTAALVQSQQALEQAKLEGRKVLAEKLATLHKKLAAAEAANDKAGVAKYTKEVGGLDKQLNVDIPKFDGELAEIPKELEALAERVAQLPVDDNTQLDDLSKRIVEKQKRLAAVEGRHAKILRSEKLLEKTHKLAIQVEILTHRLEDGQLATKVKDYRYIDRQVGGETVPALEELIRWRLWDRTGGGLMAELGSHQLDAAGIFISALRTDGKKARPLSVTAVGGRHVFPHDRDIDDHVYCSFEFPGPKYDATKAPEKKIVVSYSSINGNGFGGYGETVLGTTGTMILDKEKEVLLYQKWDTGRYVRVSGSEKKPGLVERSDGTADGRLGREALEGPVSRGYTEEIEHWAWAIRQKQEGKDLTVPLRCSPKVALADAVIALTTNLAIERGKKTGENCRIDFMDEWFDPLNDETPEEQKPNIDRPEYSV